MALDNPNPTSNISDWFSWNSIENAREVNIIPIPSRNQIPHVSSKNKAALPGFWKDAAPCKNCSSMWIREGRHLAGSGMWLVTEMINFSIRGASRRKTIAIKLRIPNPLIAVESQLGAVPIVGIKSNPRRIKNIASMTRSVTAVAKTYTLLIPVFCPRAIDRITSPDLKGKKLFPR